MIVFVPRLYHMTRSVQVSILDGSYEWAAGRLLDYPTRGSCRSLLGEQIGPSTITATAATMTTTIPPTQIREVLEIALAAGSRRSSKKTPRRKTLNCNRSYIHTFVVRHARMTRPRRRPSTSWIIRDPIRPSEKHSAFGDEDENGQAEDAATVNDDCDHGGKADREEDHDVPPHMREKGITRTRSLLLKKQDDFV
jgi:hypothetical protein